MLKRERKYVKLLSVLSTSPEDLLSWIDKIINHFGLIDNFFNVLSCAICC